MSTYGLCGISRLAKKQKRSNRDIRSLSEDIVSTDDAETLVKWLSLYIMARTTEIQVNCNVAT